MGCSKCCLDCNCSLPLGRSETLDPPHAPPSLDPPPHAPPPPPPPPAVLLRRRVPRPSPAAPPPPPPLPPPLPRRRVRRLRTIPAAGPPPRSSPFRLPFCFTANPDEPGRGGGGIGGPLDPTTVHFVGDPVYDTYPSDLDSDSDAHIRKQLKQERDPVYDIYPSDLDSDSDAHIRKQLKQERCDGMIGGDWFGFCMVVMSFLLVLNSPLLLCRFYHFSEPRTLLCAMSLVLSGYITFLISNLSSKTSLSIVPVIMAIVAERFLGSFLGLWVMHTLTGFLACMLGYTYAEHLHIGWRITTPTFLRKDDKRRFEVAREVCSAVCCLMSVVLATIGPLPLWLGPRKESHISVVFLSLLEGFSVFSWVAYVARYELYDSFLSVDQLSNIILLCILPWLGLSILLFVLGLSYFGWMGEIIGTMHFWMLTLAVAGLLGYELSVHGQFKRRALEAAGENPTVAPPVAAPAVEPAIPIDAVPQQEHHVVDRSQPEEEEKAEVVINEVPNNVAPLVTTQDIPVLQEEAPKKSCTTIVKVLKEVPFAALAPLNATASEGTIGGHQCYPDERGHLVHEASADQAGETTSGGKVLEAGGLIQGHQWLAKHVELRV